MFYVNYFSHSVENCKKSSVCVLCVRVCVYACVPCIRKGWGTRELNCNTVLKHEPLAPPLVYSWYCNMP